MEATKTVIGFSGKSLNDVIKSLELYRSGWANDIREGWNCSMVGAQVIEFELYEISGCIILALQDVQKGHFRGKMAMKLVRDKLSNLVKSQNFGDFSALSEMGASRVVTNGTKHHIRVMFECLDFLTA